MSRPLLKSDINQLETLARGAAQRKAASELLTIRDELRHRSSPRSSELLTFVERELAACPVDTNLPQGRQDLGEPAGPAAPAKPAGTQAASPAEGGGLFEEGATAASAGRGAKAAARVDGAEKSTGQAPGFGKGPVHEGAMGKGAGRASAVGGMPLTPAVPLMTPAEACKILGVALTASWEHVERARRALVTPAVLKDDGRARDLAQRANAAYLSLATARLY